MAKRDPSLHKNEVVQPFWELRLGKRRLFSEERLWFKTVAQDLTAILLLMHIHFIRNKWFCKKKEFQGRDMCKSPMKLSCIPEIFDYTQSSFSWNMTLMFHFLTQYKTAVLNGIVAVWKVERLTRDVSSKSYPGIWRSCQMISFLVCVPTRNISELLEQFITPMSSTIRLRETFHRVKVCAASARVCLLLLLSCCLSGFDPAFLHNLPSPVLP